MARFITGEEYFDRNNPVEPRKRGLRCGDVSPGFEPPGGRLPSSGRRRESSPTCDPPRSEWLTPDPGSRNVVSTGHSVAGPGGGVVVRRLISSLLPVACRPGI